MKINPTYDICIAYESGFGHGLAADIRLPNPYPEFTPEHEAYNIGFVKGNVRREKMEKVEPAPVVTTAAYWLKQARCTEFSLEERLLFMEQAYNHTNNELQTLKQSENRP